jgi:hypothetical protein
VVFRVSTGREQKKDDLTVADVVCI